MIPNFKGARKETKGWVDSIGNSVTDEKSTKALKKSTKTAQKSFIGALKETLKW